MHKVSCLRLRQPCETELAEDALYCTRVLEKKKFFNSTVKFLYQVCFVPCIHSFVPKGTTGGGNNRQYVRDQKKKKA